jgi:dienelactone hydrolase
MDRIEKIWVLALFVYSTACVPSRLSLPPSVKTEIPLGLKELVKPPSFQWVNQEDSVWSLKYQGEAYEGKVTEVFAYYASPVTLRQSPEGKGKFPAVVLIHGGGGTAFRVWALEWAKRGYAAIAMDLNGSQPLPMEEQENPWGTKSVRLSAGGPRQDDHHKFYRLEEPFSEQWQFHSLSNIIRAHSLVRSFQEVDANRTAATGISWGGYLTNLVAGIDHRFSAAVPVYGCGFLQEGSAWDKQFDSLGAEKTARWVKLWDPSQYVGQARMPMLFINGTNDFAYFVENWDKTAVLAKKPQRSLIPEMKHSHLHGAEPAEIYNFVSQQLGKVKSPASFGNFEKSGNRIKVDLKNPQDIKAFFLVYTKDKARSPERKWETLELEKGAKEFFIPQETQLCYVYWIDKQGNRRSGSLIKP